MVFSIYEGSKERDISDSVVRLKSPTPLEKNATWKLIKSLEWETGTLLEDKRGSGMMSLQCWEISRGPHL